MNDRLPLPWSKAARAQARRCRRSAFALRRHLITLCPNAPALARDPSLAERMNTTPCDHTAAGVLDAAEQFVAAIDSLLEPW